jgi:uncharacterized phage-associated protein
LIQGITSRLRDLLGGRRRKEDLLLAMASRFMRALPMLTQPHAKNRLTLLRLAYLAEALHVRRHSRTITEDAIEATNYGPLHPRLMAELRKGFQGGEDEGILDERAIACIDETIEGSGALGHAQLGALVHMGAWKKRYDASRSGAGTERGARITTADMLAQIREDEAARRKDPK